MVSCMLWRFRIEHKPNALVPESAMESVLKIINNVNELRKRVIIRGQSIATQNDAQQKNNKNNNNKKVVEHLAKTSIQRLQRCIHLIGLRPIRVFGRRNYVLRQNLHLRLPLPQNRSQEVRQIAFEMERDMRSTALEFGCNSHANALCEWGCRADASQSSSLYAHLRNAFVEGRLRDSRWRFLS